MLNKRRKNYIIEKAIMILSILIIAMSFKTAVMVNNKIGRVALDILGSIACIQLFYLGKFKKQG